MCEIDLRGWPSARELAEALGMSRRGVNQALFRVQKLQEIHVSNGGGGGEPILRVTDPDSMCFRWGLGSACTRRGDGRVKVRRDVLRRLHAGGAVYGAGPDGRPIRADDLLAAGDEEGAIFCWRELGDSPVRRKNRAIRLAAAGGYEKAVRYLLDQPRVTPWKRQGATLNYPVVAAAAGGHAGVVRLLHADGRLGVDHPPEEARTFLAMAADGFCRGAFVEWLCPPGSGLGEGQEARAIAHLVSVARFGMDRACLAAVAAAGAGPGPSWLARDLGALPEATRAEVLDSLLPEERDGLEAVLALAPRS